GGPGDVVDRPRAGDADLLALVVEVEAPAVLAARLPARLAVQLELERLLQKAPALLRVVGVRTDAVETLEREFFRDLGVVGDQRLVRVLARNQDVPQTRGVAEGEPAVGV